MERFNRMNSQSNGIAFFGRDFSLLWCSDSLKELFSEPAAELERIFRNHTCSIARGSECSDASLPVLSVNGTRGKDIRIGSRTFTIEFYSTPCGEDSSHAFTAVFTEKDFNDPGRNRYEKFLSSYALGFYTAKIVAWEYDVSSGTINNIFGNRMVFDADVLSLSVSEWESMIHPDDILRVKRGIDDILEMKNDELLIDYRIVTGPDKIMWVKTAGRVILSDEEGRPQLISGINQDITEMKLLQEKSAEKADKLRRIRSRLSNAMKLGKISSWEYDFVSDTFETDRQMAEVWGYTEYYDQGKRIGREYLIARLHPDDSELVRRVFSESIDRAEGFDISYRIIVDGETRYIHFVSEIISDEEGRPVKFIGVAQDITGMKRLEETLTRQIEGLRFIAEKVGLGIWEMNPETSEISVMNLRGYTSGGNEFSNYTIEQIEGLIHPEDVPLFSRRLKSLLAGKASVAEVEVRIRGEDAEDQYRWFYLTSVIRETDAQGAPVDIRGFYQDVTDRKEIETKLYQSQKMEAIGRLAGGIAHDFNNILQVILGYGSLAMMETDNDTELFDNISHIVDSGEKAKTLVKQLLLFARKEKFNPSGMSINDLCRGVLSMLRRLIGENITLTYEPAGDLFTIHGDPGQIEQVFLNLCINARDAISGSGSIIITTRNVTLDDFWPSFDSPIPPGRYVMISISDTGCGIPPENHSRIFEPFFTTKDKESGTGLGLATVYSIVKQHSGFIDLYSIPGKGATFTIFLPAAEQGAGAEASAGEISDEAAAPQFRTLGGETILLAEDDELVRRYTERILRDSGYRILVAENGEAAVELFSRSRGEVDLVILDVVMPKINGWDVYNAIGGTDSGIPVIFFSGYDRNLLPPDMASIPNMRFVQKPFKYYSLIKALHELLD